VVLRRLHNDDKSRQSTLLGQSKFGLVIIYQKLALTCSNAALLCSRIASTGQPLARIFGGYTGGGFPGDGASQSRRLRMA
jgi:hypothetical protein